MAYRRISRRQKKSKVNADNPFIIFNPHDSGSEVQGGVDYIRIVVIDPGIRNCGFRIARKEGPKIVTEFQERADFVKKKDGTDYYIEMIRFFSRYEEYIKWSHYIVVESQLAINYDLTRMGQHILTYLMVTVKNRGFRPIIVEIDSHTKSRMLNAPRMKKPQLKKWCVTAALHILKQRNDMDAYHLIANSKKKDDHADTVCYEYVWWIILQNNPNIPTP